MKLNKTIALFAIITFLGSTTIQAQTFIKVAGQAKDIAMSPKDGSVFVVNAANDIKKYDAKSKKFLPFGAQQKDVKSVSVAKNGVVYKVSNNGAVFLNVQGRWNLVPGVQTSEIITSKDGRIYALDTNKNLRQLSAGKWNLLGAQNRGSKGLRQVVGIGPKELFARAEDNSFMKFSAGQWKTLKGKPLQIALDHGTGIIYAVGRNRGIHTWKTNLQDWVLLPGTRKDFTAMAVHNGKMWAVANNQSIYYYKNIKGTDTSSNLDLSGTYRVYIDQLGANKGNKFYGTMGLYLEAKTASGSSFIRPMNNKPNRYWDVSKTRPEPTNGAGFTVDVAYNDVNTKKWTLKGSLTIDKEREFKVAGEAAKGNPTFDFQFNMKRENLGVDNGKWERIKIPLKNIVLGKKYYFWHKSSVSVVSFKVEKL